MKNSTKLSGFVRGSSSSGARASLSLMVAFALILQATHAFGADSPAVNSVTQQQTNSQATVLYSGTVVDQNDVPIPGVSVIVKKRPSVGTSTDIDGKFTLAVPVDCDVLVFSFIGMTTQEVRLQSGVKLKVRLQEDASVLAETVVTGIYTAKTESFTGIVSQFKADELKAIGNTSVLQSLSALDPSFNIIENNLAGSDPNAELNININGSTSINGLSDSYGSNPDRPLFILDGFETTLERISDMSMDRIESITILKDASSTAIYGAKAANGVVVVETKKPEAGRLRFTYNGNYGVSWADLSNYNLMNAAEKLEFEKLSGAYGMIGEDGQILDDAARREYFNRYRNVVSGLDTYWLNEPLRTGYSHDHSINAEGGDSAFRYGLTLRYKDNAGVMKKSDRQNIDGTVNLAYRIDKFNFSNQTNIYYTDISNNVVSFREFSQANPYYSKRNEYGEVYRLLNSYTSYTGTEYAYNPLWNFQQKSFNVSNTLQLNNNFNIEYRPIEKIRINGRFGFNTTRGVSEDFKSPFATQFIDTEELKRGSYSNNATQSTSYDASLIASYGDMIGVHTYNFVGGAQLMESNLKSTSYSAIGYISDQFSNPNFSNGYPDGGRPSSNVTRTRSASFYLNANYAYDLRYLFDVNLRTDGASVFGVNNPFSSTYSVGVAWNVHNEKFFMKSDVVNTLKIRYTFGNPGNQNINAKLANSIYNYYTAYPNPFGLAAMVSQWGNKDLKWKRTLSHNVGLNMMLFRRLTVVADYMVRKSDPELIMVEQPTSTGTSSVPMNIGATRNNSFTLTLGYDIMKKKDFIWRVNANMLNTRTTYYNIGDLLEKMNQEGRASQSLIRYYDGASSTAIYAVKSLGIDPMTGNEVFLRKDGTYTFAWDAEEEVIVGDTTPDAQGNIGTNLRWKGFSFGINFAYRFGGQAQLTTLLNKVENITQASVLYNQDRRAFSDRWQKPGDLAKFKRISDTSVTNMSSRFVADDNTVECQSITLGYENTTADWLQKAGLTSFYVRLYANNIFRISSIKEERGLNYPFSRGASASLGIRF